MQGKKSETRPGSVGWRGPRLSTLEGAWENSVWGQESMKDRFGETIRSIQTEKVTRPSRKKSWRWQQQLEFLQFTRNGLQTVAPTEIGSEFSGPGAGEVLSGATVDDPSADTQLDHLCVPHGDINAASDARISGGGRKWIDSDQSWKKKTAVCLGVWFFISVLSCICIVKYNNVKFLYHSWKIYRKKERKSLPSS